MLERTILFFALASIFLPSCDPAESVTLETGTSTRFLSATETPIPTEVPDPFEGITLPEGSGVLKNENGQWFFDSPLVVNIGTNVPVHILDHTSEEGKSETWLVLDEHSEWPLFIQNEEGTWETALEYVEVAKPLVDADGNLLPLTCEFGEDGNYLVLDCFFVVNGVVFKEGDFEYLPVAISLDGTLESPMYTKLEIPFRAEWEVSVLNYQNHVFVPSFEGLRGIGNGFTLSSIVNGDVFWLRSTYDRVNRIEFIDELKSRGDSLSDSAAYLYEKMGKDLDRVKEIFTSIKERSFHPFMQGKLVLGYPFIVGFTK